MAAVLRVDPCSSDGPQRPVLVSPRRPCPKGVAGVAECFGERFPATAAGVAPGDVAPIRHFDRCAAANGTVPHMNSKELHVYMRAREALDRMSGVQRAKEASAASRIQRWYRRQSLDKQALARALDSQCLALPNCENDPRQQLLKVFWRCCEQDETRACKRQLARVCGSLRDIANTFRMPLQIPVTPFVGTRDELEAILGVRDDSADPLISWAEFNALVTSRAYAAVIHDGLEIPSMEDTKGMLRRLFQEGAACMKGGAAADRIKLVRLCATVPELVRILGVSADVPQTPEEGLRDMFETILQGVCTSNSPGQKITWDDFWNCYVGFSREKLWQPFCETGWRSLEQHDAPVSKHGLPAAGAEDLQHVQRRQQQQQQQRAVDVASSFHEPKNGAMPGNIATTELSAASASTRATTATFQSPLDDGTVLQEAGPQDSEANGDADLAGCGVQAATPEFNEAMNSFIVDSDRFWHCQARAFAESTLFNAIRASKAVVVQEKRKLELREQGKRDAERRRTQAELATGGSEEEGHEDYLCRSKLSIFGKLPREEVPSGRKAPECLKCGNVFLSDANFCRVCGLERPAAGTPSKEEEKKAAKVPDISSMRFGGRLPNSLPLAKLQQMSARGLLGNETDPDQETGAPIHDDSSDSSSFSDSQPLSKNMRSKRSTFHLRHLRSASFASSATAADAGLAHLLEGLDINGRSGSLRSSWHKSKMSSTSGYDSRRSSTVIRMDSGMPRIRPDDFAVEQVKYNVHTRQRDFAAYRALIDEALQTIAKIKSALYNADRSGAGAEFLIQDAKMMLNVLLRGVIREAAKGQKIVEAHFQLTPEATTCIRRNAKHLEALVTQHLAVVRDEHMTETSKLQSLREQVARVQTEMATNSHSRQGPGSAGGTTTDPAPSHVSAAFPASTGAHGTQASPAHSAGTGGGEVTGAAASGFSLEDARGVLRAFATVLRPRLMSLAALEPQQRTPAEAVAFKFLSACAGEVAPTAGEGGPPSPSRGPHLAAAQTQGGPGTPSWGFRTPLPEQQQHQQQLHAQMGSRLHSHADLGRAASDSAGVSYLRRPVHGSPGEETENTGTTLPSFGGSAARHHGQYQRDGRGFNQAAEPDLPAFFDPEEVVTPAEPSTRDYIMQQTMLRVKHPRASLDFYTKVLGFRLITWRDYPEMGFSVYYLAHCSRDEVPQSPEDRWDFCMSCPGCIALTWNHGTEKEKGALYNTGNNDATGSMDGKPVQGGFGHIGVAVPDVRRACQRFESLGCDVVKKHNVGGSKGSTFIRDPDGYLVEILPQGMPVFT